MEKDGERGEERGGGEEQGEGEGEDNVEEKGLLKRVGTDYGHEDVGN